MTSNVISKCTICVVFAMLAVGTMLRAADITGSIDGVVKDASGGVAPGISVVVTNVATSAVFNTTTDSTGTYNISVAPGDYQLTVQAQGFKKFTASDIHVAGERSRRALT